MTPPAISPSWPRVLRLTLTGVLGALLTLDVALAWLFLNPLLHPGCSAPMPIPGRAAPQEIRLESGDGLSLRALYYPGRNGRAILTLGGRSGSLGLSYPPADFLLDAGYAVLQIDSRACAGAPVTLGAREPLDAQAGLNYLLDQPDVSADRIALYGFSMGGAAAILTAAQRPQVRAVIAEGGYHNLGQDFVEPGSERSLPQIIFLNTLAGIFWLRTGVNPWLVSPVDAIREISPRPVLLIYGEKEAGSGRAEAQFAAAGEPKELWIVPGGAHGTNHQVAQEVYEQIVLEFLARALK